jgi:hypothetical protein
MNSKIMTLSSMAVAAAVGVLLFVSGSIVVNQQAFAYGYHGGYGYHGYHGGYNYGYRPCGGGPFTIVGGQITCTLDAP